MRPDGQVLVNLGLIHLDSEWQPYWSGWIDWLPGSLALQQALRRIVAVVAPVLPGVGRR